MSSRPSRPGPLDIAILSWRDTTHPDGGGSEVFVEEVARELVRRGHRVTLRCAAHGDAPAEQDLDGVRLMRRGARLTVYPRSLLWVARHRRRYDVVLDVINGIPFGTPLVRRRGLVGLVHHVHQRQWQIIYPGFWGRVGWFVESRLTPLLYRRVPFLTVSEASATDLARLGTPAAAITVARNGLAVAPAAVPRSASPRLCVLARLVPHKQIEHALAVVERLRPEFPDLRLDIVGEGWWHDRLQADAEQRGVEKSVTFHGRVSDAERDRLLAEAWLALLPSAKEGWGLAVLEAAAQGTPTVAYRDAGGVAESIVDGRTGILAENEDDLVAVTRQLLSDAELRERMGTEAVAWSRRFTWEATTDVVEEVLRSS
ncbi:glycosyltransferase family 4 protein [Nocardioides speluncae]|uniref:glycosyltransferase family 4 protein n=1 Tax=Nocardioides speluncae TaxID=2670337 RepID=UPI000D69E8EF|nr:glycosyltransferase family 4 protein [Nocardioides speluncae]